MTEYTGIIVTGKIEGAPDGRDDGLTGRETVGDVSLIVEGVQDGWDDGLTGRESVSVDVGMVNFSPGAVGAPGDCVPYPVIKGVQDGWDDGLTGRETVGDVESLMRGFPESVFGKRTSGYIVGKSGTPLTLPGEAIVTLVSDPSSAENDKAANVGTNGFYETFLEGGYDKWYLIVEKGDGKYDIYEKDPADPPINGDSIPDTRNLGFVKVKFKSKTGVIQFGRYIGGLS